MCETNRWLNFADNVCHATTSTTLTSLGIEDTSMREGTEHRKLARSIRASVQGIIHINEVNTLSPKLGSTAKPQFFHCSHNLCFRLFLVNTVSPKLGNTTITSGYSLLFQCVFPKIWVNNPSKAPTHVRQILSRSPHILARHPWTTQGTPGRPQGGQGARRLRRVPVQILAAPPPKLASIFLAFGQKLLTQNLG